LAKVWG